MICHQARLRNRLARLKLILSDSARVYEAPSANVSVHAMYEDYRNWFASTGLRGQLGRKQFANRVEAADIAKSSRRSQGYFFMNVNLR